MALIQAQISIQWEYDSCVKLTRGSAGQFLLITGACASQQ